MTNTNHQVIGAMKIELSGKEVASMQGSAPQEVASMGKPTHPPPPRQLGTCIATKKVGAAIKDHNQGGSSTGKTWEECLELCCKDIQCKSFDYVSTSGNCYISHNKWDEVGQQYRKENKEPTVSYNEIEITPLPLKTPFRRKDRIFFGKVCKLHWSVQGIIILSLLFSLNIYLMSSAMGHMLHEESRKIWIKIS